MLYRLNQQQILQQMKKRVVQVELAEDGGVEFNLEEAVQPIISNRRIRRSIQLIWNFWNSLKNSKNFVKIFKDRLQTELLKNFNSMNFSNFWLISVINSLSWILKQFRVTIESY